MVKEKLRVGVFLPPSIPQSFKVYYANVVKYFPENNLIALPFDSAANLPQDCDVFWDIRSGGGNPPLAFMLGTKPLVVTVHGFAPVTLPASEYFDTFWEKLTGPYYALRKLAGWRQYKDSVAALIAVSEFSRQEAIRLTGVPSSKIHVCYHGVDVDKFYYDSCADRQNYFLHISNNEPRKNLTRIVNVFRRLRRKSNVELLLKLPYDQASRYQGIDGVRVLSAMVDVAQLADLYRNALAFVFPSLYEGFGLPILEAMASGCPVITSNVSACPEIAGDAAVIVDPRDETELLQAMEACLDPNRRENLSMAGLARGNEFTWENSTAGHARVFYEVV